MAKLRKGDQVKVIAGKDKGKQGEIEAIFSDQDTVLVSGVNIVKKHRKGNPNLNQTSTIQHVGKPIAISNVAILNPKTQKADKVGFKYLEDGCKIRVFKSDGEVIQG